jgi:hypothetical protein
VASSKAAIDRFISPPDVVSSKAKKYPVIMPGIPCPA